MLLDILDNGLLTTDTPQVVCGVVLAVVLGYLLGSVNFGVVISRVFYHDDVRNHGSGGAGATNMLRTFGVAPAAATFIGDWAKTLVAVLIGAILLGYDAGFYGTYICGTASIVGHAYPVYYGFKGGKCVAATFGLVLCTQPIIAGICMSVFVLTILITRYVSLASILAVLVYAGCLIVYVGMGIHIAFAVFLACLLIFRHKNNIVRLLKGTENKFKLSKSKQEEEVKA